MSKCIGVLPSRGGTGASTVAVHLAHALGRRGDRVCLAAGGAQAKDLALIQQGLSFLDDDVRLELALDGSVEEAIAQAEGEFVIADLPVGFVAQDTKFSALVVVVQSRPASLAAAWESLQMWEGACPLFVLVNGSPWPLEGQWIGKRFASACAANGSVRVEALAPLDRSFLLSRCVVSGKTAFDLAPYLPVSKAVERIAERVSADETTVDQVNLGELRSERAA